MQAIVICTVGNAGITVLLESIRVYTPDIPVFLFARNPELERNARKILPNVVFRQNNGTNFGDSYNEAIDATFAAGYESVIVSNDDVVLTPTSVSLLLEDACALESASVPLGFVGARSDYVLPDQNIRFQIAEDQRNGVKWESEYYIKETGVIAPIFAYLTKQAWSVAKFPSTNWYSDNIICYDLQKAGYRHFVSRSYVHHAGSQTVGTDFKKCHEEPRAWIKENRPDMYESIYG